MIDEIFDVAKYYGLGGLALSIGVFALFKVERKKSSKECENHRSNYDEILSDGKVKFAEIKKDLEFIKEGISKLNGGSK